MRPTDASVVFDVPACSLSPSVPPGSPWLRRRRPTRSAHRSDMKPLLSRWISDLPSYPPRVSTRLRWILFAGFLVGAVIAIALPLFAAKSAWSWYGDYWEALLIAVGVGLALGTMFFVFQSTTSQEIRQETLRRPAVELSRATAPPVDPTGGDVTPPQLVEFAIEPESVDVSDSLAEIVLRAHLVDDHSGLAGPGYSSSPTQVRFQSPTARQFIDGLFESHRHLISGTALDGHYETRATIPRFAEAGKWSVAYFLLVDQVGNTQYLSADELQQAGIPTSFVVTSA